MYMRIRCLIWGIVGIACVLLFSGCAIALSPDPSLEDLDRRISLNHDKSLPTELDLFSVLITTVDVHGFSADELAQITFYSNGNARSYKFSTNRWLIGYPITTLGSYYIDVGLQDHDGVQQGLLTRGTDVVVPQGEFYAQLVASGTQAHVQRYASDPSIFRADYQLYWGGDSNDFQWCEVGRFDPIRESEGTVEISCIPAVQGMIISVQAEEGAGDFFKIFYLLGSESMLVFSVPVSDHRWSENEWEVYRVINPADIATH